MWSKEGHSEGIGVNLNGTLQQYFKYTLCFAYRTYNQFGTQPVNIHIRLANGYTDNPTCAVGAPTPAFPGTQEVAQIAFPAGTGWSGWNLVSVTFVSMFDFQQILIYPHTDTDSDSPPTVLVDYFSLHVPTSDCVDQLHLVQTSIPVFPGIYDNRSYIRAGSHVNGSTTTNFVTAGAPVLTKFSASEYVRLEDNFIAQPVSGAVFLAMIEGCGYTCREPSGGGNNSQSRSLPLKIEELSGNEKQISLFPNPAKEYIILQSVSILKSAILTDLSGRILKTFDFKPHQSQYELELNELKAGIYLVSIKDSAGNSTVKKLVIEK
jgi:hypothetical protein